MDLTDTDLPDDIDALKALVRAHAASAHANAQRVVELQDQLSSRVIEIEHLNLTIAKLHRMQFGRKSEKLERQIEQLEPRLEELQADEGAAAQAAPNNRMRSLIDASQSRFPGRVSCDRDGDQRRLAGIFQGAARRSRRRSSRGWRRSPPRLHNRPQ